MSTGPVQRVRPARWNQTGRLRRAIVRSGVLLLLPLVGCGINLTPTEPNDPVPPAPVDFARALELGRMAFDVTRNDTVTDDALRARYGADGVQVDIFSTIFPGDSGRSRFMLLTDPVQRKHTLVLAGTNTLEQWVFDSLTNFTWQPDLGANLHTGWNALVFPVYNYVLPELHSDFSITVTGYSLGAALAAIVSEYLLEDGYRVDEVVTFGQPPITDVAGAAVLSNLPLTRFVSARDPFPYVKDTQADSAQFGQMVVLYDGPDYAYLPSGDARLQAGMQPFASFLMPQIENHAAWLYTLRLRAKLETSVQVHYLP